MLYIVFMFDVQGRQLYFGDFVKNMFQFGLVLEPISFILDQMIGIANLCILIPV